MKESQIHILKKFREIILPHKDAKLIVACSGGKDSMVLGHLLLESEIRFAIAHVNFGLRAGESDGDELFVKSFANKYDLPFYSLRANPSESLDGEGIQEWARRIRYEWFEKLLAETASDFILTAHHKNDQAETILHQFIRGGGLSSLTGMEKISGSVWRPLLSFERKELDEYATSEEIAWREDSSNSKTDYTRNYVRQVVMPSLEKINPDIVSSLAERAVWFREAEAAVDSTLESEIKSMLNKEEKAWKFPLSWMEDSPFPRLLFWKILQPADFSSAQVEEAMGLLSSDPGKYISSDKAKLWKDRNDFILEFNAESAESQEVKIPSAPFFISSPIILEGRCEPFSESIISPDPSAACLDSSKLKWPLTLRQWREGDRFRPLGMKGEKKISDFLIQLKIPMSQKKNVHVLVSGEEIAWVVGYRISENFKASPATTEVTVLNSGF